MDFTLRSNGTEALDYLEESNEDYSCDFEEESLGLDDRFAFEVELKDKEQQPSVISKRGRQRMNIIEK